MRSPQVRPSDHRTSTAPLASGLYLLFFGLAEWIIGTHYFGHAETWIVILRAIFFVSASLVLTTLLVIHQGSMRTVLWWGIYSAFSVMVLRFAWGAISYQCRPAADLSGTCEGLRALANVIGYVVLVCLVAAFGLRVILWLQRMPSKQLRAPALALSSVAAAVSFVISFVLSYQSWAAEGSLDVALPAAIGAGLVYWEARW